MLRNVNILCNVYSFYLIMFDRTTHLVEHILFISGVDSVTFYMYVY